MDIYFVRHGKEEEGFRGGWSQRGLADEGKKQARMLAEYLYENKKKINFTRIISSDLNRAKETAFYIGKKLEMKVELSQEWREHNNGIMAGMENEKAEIEFPGLYFNTAGMDERYRMGESPREFLNRIEKAFYNLVDEVLEKNENILIVTHGGVINIIYHLINKVKWNNKNKAFKVQNASIHKIELDKEKIKISLSNYIEHLN